MTDAVVFPQQGEHFAPGAMPHYDGSRQEKPQNPLEAQVQPNQKNALSSKGQPVDLPWQKIGRKLSECMLQVPIRFDLPPAPVARRAGLLQPQSSVRQRETLCLSKRPLVLTYVPHIHTRDASS